jgi:V/A-type H+-transporting ATPase subunit D
MSRLRLSKGALQQQRGKLALYRKLLPSLELKRRLLSMELAAARAAQDALELRLAQLLHAGGERLPMIARPDVPVKGLLQLREVRTRTENIAGVRVPVFESASFEHKSYSYLTRPAWLDILVEALREAALARIELRLARERRELLEIAAKRMSQRVNLFERVLIPRALGNIRRLQIFLGDLDRDAVIRSKIAKRRMVAGR